uniref:Desiccation-related protein PCC13-62 n=1 Tax=Cannabis sativa TaxID=3483 RepID=A0A803NHI1_CANSA
MAIISSTIHIFVFLLAMEPGLIWGTNTSPCCEPVEATDNDKIQFALNLEFMEAEFFLRGALGEGLDAINSSLAEGGPPPIGARKANLDPLTHRIIEEFGYQEVGHIRAIINTVGGFPRPLIDLSPQNFAKLFNKAVGFTLKPSFDPYANSLNYLLASYVIPYVGLVGYVGTIPGLTYYTTRRTLIMPRTHLEYGYFIVVGSFTFGSGIWAGCSDKNIVERASHVWHKDEGLRVPKKLGAENRTTSNILSADAYSLSYLANTAEILRTVYGTGNESRPGGFYPHGANGNIARSFLFPDKY